MKDNAIQYKIQKEAQQYLPLFKKHREKQRDNYSPHSKKLYKNSKTSDNASRAILRIFRGELVNIDNLQYFKFNIS